VVNSGDWMQGPFADAARHAVTSILRYLGYLSEEWDQLGRALNRAATEADAADRMQAVGLAPQCGDPAEWLRPYRTWAPEPFRLGPGWAQSNGRAGRVMINLDLARRLAGHLREGSEAFEAERRQLAHFVAPFGIEVPHAFTSLADAAWEIADEVERRVEAYERVEEEIVRSARSLVQAVMAPFAGLVSGTRRASAPRQPRTDRLGPSPKRPLPVATPARLADARAVLPTKRFKILKSFFSQYGGEKDGLGYGEALNTFMEWEQRSGRLRRRGGDPWWMAVNGSMMLDMAEAQRLLKRNQRARSANPAVQAWIAFATSKKDRQKKLWHAHQVSLHAGIRAADRDGLYDALPPNEQRFVEQVVENVDLTALSNMSSGSIGRRDLSGTVAAIGMDEYLDRVYPDGPVATEADLERVEDWAMPGVLMDPSGVKYLEAGGVIGMESTKW